MRIRAADHTKIRAFFDVELHEGVTIGDMMLFAGPNVSWIAPQGIPQLDSDGRHRIVGGRRQYTRNTTFSDASRPTS